MKNGIYIEVMDFEVKGVFGKDKKVFSKKVEAKSEKLAREKTLALLGSEHKIKRRLIEISEINELKE